MNRKMPLELRQILGTPNGLVWSQVHYFLSGEKEKRSLRGELVLLVSFRGREIEQELASLGREIIARVNEEYFGNLKERPMTRLKKTLLKVGQEKSAYFQGPADLLLLTLVLWRGIIYLGIWGQGEILLRRQGKTAVILQGEKNQVRVASGLAQDDDLFLLATRDLIEKVPQGMIRAVLSTEDLETIAEVLLPVVHAREKQGSLAGVAIKILAKPSGPTGAEEPEKGEEIKKTEKFWAKLKLIQRLTWLTKKGGSIFRRWIPKTSSLTVALGFLALLTLSVFLGWQKRRAQQREKRREQLVAQISEKLEAAQMIKGLDPNTSLQLIEQTRPLIEELIRLEPRQGENYQAQVKSLALGLGGEKIKPQLYYDLHLLAEAVEIKSFFSQGEEVLLLDQKHKRLMKVNLAQKSGQILAGGEELAQTQRVVFSGQRIYLVQRDQISQLQKGKLNQIRDLTEAKEILDVDGWLGNLYLLDGKAEQIWKYPVIKAGLGEPQPWLKAQPDFSFSHLTDMAIDGAIWLLLDNGRIYKFFAGREGRFSQQSPSGISRAQYLTLAQKSERLSFWDQEKKTIWLFNKNGAFLARVPVELDEVRGLILAPEGEKIYLLTKDKIYYFTFQF